MRRNFIIFFIFFVIYLFFRFFTVPYAFISELYNRIRNRFKRSANITNTNNKNKFILPNNSNLISVELALNSRCTSDFDNDPTLFHWGMFDTNYELSENQLDFITKHIKTLQFFNSDTDVLNENNKYYFLTNINFDINRKDAMLIESGMRQQALCLFCASFGIGVLLKGYGENGKIFNEKKNLIMRIQIGPMKPAYNGKFWTESKPSGKRKWLKGNLPEPQRTSSSIYTTVLTKLKPELSGSKKAGLLEIGQLLWAGKGRTPHLYKSKEYGMTIPTSQGAQNLTSIYLYHQNTIYQYINWKHGRPTHHIRKIQENAFDQASDFKKLFSKGYEAFFIISQNSFSNKATLEVGFQLFNIILQATALDLYFETEILDTDKKEAIYKPYIQNPMAVVMINAEQNISNFM